MVYDFRVLLGHFLHKFQFSSFEYVFKYQIIAENIQLLSWKSRPVSQFIVKILFKLW